MHFERSGGRGAADPRPVTIEPGYLDHAEGSALIRTGDTRVLCTASVETGVPPWLRGQGQGWVTAEYGMLPRATHTRSRREASAGKQGGRTLEIQRLIARSLRMAVNLNEIGEHTITVDCDVLQADGGTRTAAITGGWVALALAIGWMRRDGVLATSPLRRQVAAVSVGVVEGVPIADLDYREDSNADTDANVVMLDNGHFVEVQATAEREPFDRPQLTAALDLAQRAIEQLFAHQRAAIEAIG